MKTILVSAVLAAIGSAAFAQDFYAGASADYMYPHSGDTQTVGSLIAGVGFDRGLYGYGAEVEIGAHLAGDADYGTQRLRGFGTYDLGAVKARVAGGITGYDFDGGSSDGYNLGIGVENDISDKITLRAEFIRDFMDDSFTAAVTTTRIGAFYNF